MKVTQALIPTFACLAAAAPYPGASKPKAGLTDGDILNYALTLEHLEDTFYRTGLKNFTKADFAAAGFDEAFYNNIMVVSSDESTHVSFLTTALQAAKVTPVAACTYSFPVTDVKSFITVASILEGVGVSAYLGAAASIMSKTYLTDAGSILTVEARHTAYIRAGLMEKPFAQPFDDPLTPNEVYTLAAQFIVECPKSNPALPVKAFPTLTASSTDASIKTGSTVMLSTPGYTLKVPKGATVYAAFITVTGPIFVTATPVAGGFTVQVPAGVNGQSYVVINGCNTEVSDDTVAAGPAIVEISN